MTAGYAKSQMQPYIADFQTLFTAIRRSRRNIANFKQVGTAVHCCNPPMSELTGRRESSIVRRIILVEKRAPAARVRFVGRRRCKARPRARQLRPCAFSKNRSSSGWIVPPRLDSHLDLACSISSPSHGYRAARSRSGPPLPSILCNKPVCRQPADL